MNYCWFLILLIGIFLFLHLCFIKPDFLCLYFIVGISLLTFTQLLLCLLLFNSTLVTSGCFERAL